MFINAEPDPLLDLDPWVGQRQCTFRFDVQDAVTKEVIGEIHPIRGANLTHDTGKTIKRTLNMQLGRADTAAINTLTDRVLPYMVFPNSAEYPLGKYLFTSESRNKFTSGNLGTYILNDEMFVLDQQIRKGINGASGAISSVVLSILDEFDIEHNIEPSNFVTNEAWTIGTFRGKVLDALALSGDYFSPWFDNDGVFRMIRTFNPVNRVPDLDYDQGNMVLRSGIVETSDLLTAPNIIMVISNTPAAVASTSTGDSLVGNVGNLNSQIVGVAEVAPSAPNSIAKRGFEIPDVRTLQLASAGQAQAVANGLAQRLTVFERVQLTTPPDPRHDSYNVIVWDNDVWLELSWSMALVEGGTMNHLLRKAYSQ